MPSQLYRYFTNDHRRLEDLLDRATVDLDNIDLVLYNQFRRGLLKHISMEEKILIPVAQKHRGGEALPIAAKLRLDHGAIAALLVPPPTRTIIAALRGILAQHDLLEESHGGAYEICEQLVGDGMDSLMDMVRNASDVPPNAYNPNPNVMDAVRRALARAGYNLADYERG